MVGEWRVYRRLHPPQQGCDLAEDFDILAHDDGLEKIVFRLQANGAVFAVIPLDGGLVLDHRDDDLAVFSRLLLAHDDVIAVENAGVDHAGALDGEDEVFAFAQQFDRQHHLLVDFLQRGDRVSGGDMADDGNGQRGVP